MARVNLFLDIETAALPQLPPPPESVVQKGMGNLVNGEKIAAKEKANIDKWYDDAPLNWFKGQVIAYGYMEEEDDAPQLYTTENHTEVELLSAVWQGNWPTINVVGYNIRTFDLPFLRWRSVFNGIKPPRLNLAKFRTDLGVLDLFEAISEWGQLDMTGWTLGYTCGYFGLPTEPYGSGKDVAEWYKNGEWSEIKKHLEADVLMTRDLYQLCAAAF